MSTDERLVLRSSDSADDSAQCSCAAGRSPNGTETLLTKYVEEILSLPHVELTQHFAELGGDSLAAMQLTARLSDALGIDISPILPFQADTLGELATWIDGLRR